LAVPPSAARGHMCRSRAGATAGRRDQPAQAIGRQSLPRTAAFGCPSESLSRRFHFAGARLPLQRPGVSAGRQAGSSSARDRKLKRLAPEARALGQSGSSSAWHRKLVRLANPAAHALGLARSSCTWHRKLVRLAKPAAHALGQIQNAHAPGKSPVAAASSIGMAGPVARATAPPTAEFRMDSADRGRRRDAGRRQPGGASATAFAA
jgi:hypothetical protein